MEKKVLIAVDGSSHAEYALKYAAQTYAWASELKFVLFHVQPTISQYLLDEAGRKPGAHAELEKLKKTNSQASRKLLETHQEKLISLGVDAADIQFVSLPRKFGAAKDILEYSISGMVDAIVMGRRGISGLTELFAGSVSAAVVDNSKLIPVWLVDEKSAGQEIMVAVDGSQNSLRAVDHLAFMLQNNSEAIITFFHMTPRLQDFCPIDFDAAETGDLEEILQEGDQACIDQFYARARKKLAQAGIDDHQIKINVKQGGLRVGRAVLDAFRKGSYGTLVIGRRGDDKKFFTGSVSRHLINNFSQGALWVVP
ncbi:MAG: universal stress protein [Desulfobacterales bacterium]